MKIFTWILRLLAAIILLQTLFYKFTAHPDSVYIFSKIGMEPWGRIGTGVLELITAILLLIPRTTFIGAFSGILILGGAIFFHLTALGIEVQDDSGQLFYLAILTFLCCLGLLIIHKREFNKIFKFRISRR